MPSRPHHAIVALLLAAAALLLAPAAGAEPLPVAPSLSVTETQRLSPEADFTHEALSAHIGAHIEYRIHVVNTGTASVAGIDLSHPACANLTSDTAGLDGTGDVLDSGQAVNYYCSHVLGVGDGGDTYDSGVAVGGAADVVTIAIVRPGLTLSVEQKTGTLDFTHDAIQVDAGQTISYRIVVTNSGNTTLYGVGIAAARCSDLGSADLQFGGIADTYQPGESVTFDCFHLVGRGIDTYTAGISVVGYDALSGQVAAADQVTATVLHPDIALTLTEARSGDAQRGGPIDVHVGDPIDYEISVANTGDSPVIADLETVRCDAIEADTAGFDGTADTYDPGASVTFRCRHVVGENDFSPYVVGAEVIAHDLTAALIQRQASVSATVLHPGLSVVVEQQETHSRTWTTVPIEVLEGESIRYTITVQNTGDTALSTVNLSADGCSDPVSQTPGFDGAGDEFRTAATARFTCMKSDLAAQPPFWKTTAVASGLDPLGGPAQATASADAGVNGVPRGVARVEGMVFNDKNANGVQDEGESGIDEAVVYNDADRSGRRERGEPAAATHADGYYRLSGLAPGPVSIHVDTVDGMTCSFPRPCGYGFELQGGQIKTGVNFGEAPARGSQAVLGSRFAPGSARLLGRTGCVNAAFAARVIGKRIASVTFTLDGKRLKKVTRRSGGAYKARVAVESLRRGVHRIVARVAFKASTTPKAKTLRLTFQRCSGRRISPRFTS
ncbi:MAG TPA: SdrD B-like domain-containing protein [Thermoleophilaceae bacterium]